MDQMNHSDFLSIFNFESNQGDPISNCQGVELLRVKLCRQEFKKVPFTQGLRQDLADVLFLWSTQNDNFINSWNAWNFWHFPYL